MMATSLNNKNSIEEEINGWITPMTSKMVSRTPLKDPSGIFDVPTPVRRAEHSVKKLLLQNSPSIKTTKKANMLESKIMQATPSPVGIYIRSLPEPMIIENVRSTKNKKELQINPAAAKPPSIAVIHSEGRWSVARTSRSISSCASPNNEPSTQQSESQDFQAVLPSVLHEAAASIINEVPIVQAAATPGTSGKIGKLLERAVVPTVFKHQGRIQMSKDSVHTSKVIHSPMSVKSEATYSDLMEVSILENLSRGKPSSIPGWKPFPSCKK